MKQEKSDLFQGFQKKQWQIVCAVLSRCVINNFQNLPIDVTTNSFDNEHTEQMINKVLP